MLYETDDYHPMDTSLYKPDLYIICIMNGLIGTRVLLVFLCPKICSLFLLKCPWQRNLKVNYTGTHLYKFYLLRVLNMHFNQQHPVMVKHDTLSVCREHRCHKQTAGKLTLQNITDDKNHKE